MFGGEGQNGTALSESQIYYLSRQQIRSQFHFFLRFTGDLYCYNSSSGLWSRLNEGPSLYGFVHGYVIRQSRWYITHGE